MSDVMPLSTVLAFGLPPIGFIIAVICYFIISSDEED